MKILATLLVIALAIAGCMSNNETYNEYADGVVFTADWQTYQEILRKRQFYFIEYIDGVKHIASPGYDDEASCLFALQHTITDGRTIVCGQSK